MAQIIVTDRQGNTHALDAAEGWRVMEILRDNDIGVEGTCGGQCDCATCHVLVEDAWMDKLSPPTEEEEFKLDELPTVQPNSRLACQIIWDDSLDGLKLTLADH